ncbi:MAG: DUF4876 domain-containing protein [Bacteroidales bacterium]
MKHNIIYFIFILCLLTSCLKELKNDDFSKDAISSTIKIKVEMPQGHNKSVEGMTIQLTDFLTGLQYSAITNSDGIATVEVAYGTYVATTQMQIRKVGAIDIYNGTTQQIRVTPSDPKIITGTLKLTYSKTGQIIIKEIYYGGCWNEKINKSYTKDQYFILYNNSNYTAYLDSICIGIINPLNAPSNGRVSDWVKPGTTELRDSIPCGIMVWMFNGNGTSIPLEPGKEVVCCVNAIDHSIAVPASVNLGKPGYFALYAQGITTMQSAPMAGVKTLDLIWRAGSSTGFPISVVSPGLVIFTLGGKNIKDYIYDNLKTNPKNPANRNNDCLFVDKNLILDGVECFKSNSDSKRFRSEIDNGFAITSGMGKGEKIVRKIDNILAVKGEIIIYVDTNNSTNDFEVIKHE